MKEYNFDSVIIISQTIWKKEMRSNRFHYTTRFAKLVPTYFIQNHDKDDNSLFEDLEDQLTLVNPIFHNEFELFETILSHMRKRGIHRPLIWIYTPRFINVLKSLTFNHLTVYHATEAYFGSDLFDAKMAVLYKEYLDDTRNIINLSDITIAVSDGVAKGIQEEDQINTSVRVVSNGCDYHFWSSGLKTFERQQAVVYQGGIHRKLDFEMIDFIIKDNPDIEFWFCGELSIGYKKDKIIWNNLQAYSNFKYFGKLPVETVLDLVSKAKVGIIPFRMEDWLVEKSFPLKAFEYLSAGLKVVSTPIMALEKFSSEFNFAMAKTEFSQNIKNCIANYSFVSDDTLEICKEQDYDNKFKQSIELIAQIPSKQTPSTARFKKNLLVIYDKRSCHVNTITEHINAFGIYSRHNIHYKNGVGNEFISPEFLATFEAVIVHYSIRLSSPGHLSEQLYMALQKFIGVKVLFIQDEYDNLKSTYDYMSKIDFDLVYTCVPKPYLNYVYPKEKFPNVLFEHNLTGYVSYQNINRNFSPINERKVDVFYRGRELPYIYGSLGREKFEIGEKFARHCVLNNIELKLDLEASNEKRIYGESWYRTIANSKVMLGTESGSNVFDFQGDLGEKIQLEVERGKSYNEVYDLFIKDKEKEILMNQISPKAFEAIGLKTVLVLYEGEYSGVLEPNVHYIPLKKNFSNFMEVIAIIRDGEKLEKIATRAYEDVILNPALSYEKFIENFDHVIDRTVPLIKNQRLHVPKLLDIQYVLKAGLKLRKSKFIRKGFSVQSNTIPSDHETFTFNQKSGSYVNEILFPLNQLKFKVLMGSPTIVFRAYNKIKGIVNHFFLKTIDPLFKRLIRVSKRMVKGLFLNS